MPRQNRIPSYRLHRPSGRAVVTLLGKDVYLGAHNTPQSRAEYERVIGEWLTRSRLPGVRSPATPTVAEVMVAYLLHCETYYRDAAGKVTRQLQNIKYALRPLEALYASVDVSDFGPLSLKAVRRHMIESDLARGVINQRIGHLKRMFRWAASEELIPPDIYHALASVEGLRRGRSEARETDPVDPVSDEDVDAVLPFLCPTLRAMVELQRLTGMRSGELVSMRGAEVDRTASVWR